VNTFLDIHDGKFNRFFSSQVHQPQKHTIKSFFCYEFQGEHTIHACFPLCSYEFVTYLNLTAFFLSSFRISCWTIALLDIGAFTRKYFYQQGCESRHIHDYMEKSMMANQGQCISQNNHGYERSYNSVLFSHVMNLNEYEREKQSQIVYATMM